MRDIIRPMDLLRFHATATEYTDEQTHVYHDQSECPEGKKIRSRHRIDGAGGRTRCKECERIDIASRAKGPALDPPAG